MPKWPQTRISYDFLVVNFQFYILTFFDSELSYIVWIFSYFNEMYTIYKFGLSSVSKCLKCKLSLKKKQKQTYQPVKDLSFWEVSKKMYLVAMSPGKYSILPV